MKKILILATIMALIGCTSASAEVEIPEFAKKINGYIWLQMSPQAQIIFLVGFACGQYEMTIWLDKPEAWKQLTEAEITFQQLADGITQYYLQTGQMQDSVLMVHRIIISIAIEAEKEFSVPGSI